MFATIEEAIEEIKLGKMIIVVDDENRENEGDFIMPAQNIHPTDVNFMARYGRGLICAPMDQKTASKLDLDPMIATSEDSMQTAFTVSVDAAMGISTGISVSDRALTLNLLANSRSGPKDFVRPGHIFPLISKADGVIERPGHTEAAVDLCELAGFAPVGVICEILTESGRCARLPDLEKLAQEFDLKIITIENLIEYKTSQNKIAAGETYANP